MSTKRHKESNTEQFDNALMDVLVEVNMICGADGDITKEERKRLKYAHKKLLKLCVAKGTT